MSTYPRDAKDPHWVTISPRQMVNVRMTPVHADAYQRWLRDNGLHLHREVDEAGSDIHTIRVRDERWEQFP